MLLRYGKGVRAKLMLQNIKTRTTPEQPGRAAEILSNLGPAWAAGREREQSFSFLSFGSGYTEIVAAGINTLRSSRKVQS